MTLPGPKKYDLPVPVKQQKWQEEIDLANEIPIQLVLEKLYQDYVPSDLTRSWKAHCPLGYEHPDSGIERTMRVYQTNTAYCFSTHGFLSPVRLAAIRWDCSSLKAARRLSLMYGEVKAKEHYRDKMKRLILEAETKHLTGSAQTAVAALNNFLSQDYRYTSRQFDPDVTLLMETLLEQLDEAINENRRGAVREWFTQAKKKATELLDATEAD